MNNHKPTTSGIDWNDYHKRYQQNLILGADILKIFIAELPSQLTNIIEHCHNKKYQEMQSSVHKLHGSACYACVPDLKNILHQIESFLKNNNTQPLSQLVKLLPTELSIITADYRNHHQEKHHD